MAGADGGPVIIKKKKKGGHGGHHGGSWKVAYADFVTAMMAFFLVMWILGLDQRTRQVIGAYFQNPVGFEKTYRGGDSPIGEGTSVGMAGIVPQESAGPIGGEEKTPDQARQEQEEKERIAAVEETLKGIFEAQPDLAKLRQYVEITVQDDVLLIELVEGSDSLFFTPASAQVGAKAEKLLRLIGRELGRLGALVVIEGHTDTRPLARGDGYTNWELSVDRANAARRVLRVGGLREEQVIEVRGYAHRRLRNRQNPASPVNRRVSILAAYRLKALDKIRTEGLQ